MKDKIQTRISEKRDGEEGQEAARSFEPRSHH